VFQKAFAHFTTTGNYQDGSTYVIKLGADQDWSNQTVWWFNPTYTGTQRYTIIITSTDATVRTIASAPSDKPIMSIKQGITLIIDETIIIDNKNNAGAESGAFWLSGGGKLILDGGTVKNRASNAGSRGGIAVMDHPGTYPAFILINAGTIEGLNNVAAPIALNTDTVVVMHDGEIKSHSIGSGSPGIVKAGAIGLGGSNQNVNVAHLGAAGVYITGGSITGNTVASGATATAGAIVTVGEFQKTGGVVSGNTVNSTGNNKGQIVVLTAPDANPAAGSAFIRTADSGADDTLFVDCVKSAKDTAGTFTVPVWAASSWD
jgi:hypothetical protein